MSADVEKALGALGAKIDKLTKLLAPGGLESETVNKLELVAMRAVVTAARRARMLRGGGSSMIDLADALEQLDEVAGEDSSATSGPG